jgi:hypothetical protein
MGLSFLNGAFLGALSLVGVPILIHLLQRRRFQVVRWGAMEFLQVSQRNRRRRLFIEQLLLLLLRCLVVALVVLAICRPVARLGALPIANQRGPVHAVLILDNSGSMGYRPPGAGTETVLDRARRRALDVVERGLRQGDAVSVVLASDPPRALVRRPSLDLPAVAGVLRREKTPADAGTSYGKAARLALEILGESTFVNREVYLIADNQATGWEGGAGQPAAWEALAKLARVVLLPVRVGPAPNVAVEWVQAARGLAIAGSASRLQARIVNHSSQPVRGLMATLEVDGKPEGAAQRVDLDPNGGALVSFTPVFDQPGVRACAVRLAEDRLPADDVGYLSLRVRRSVKVLVVNGKPNVGSPQKDGAFFLQLALSPPAAGPGSETSPLELRVVNGAGGFASADLGAADVVVFSDVAALGEGERRRLAEFVQNGGGALFFLGDRVNAPLYNRDLFAAKPALLPARLATISTEKTALDAASLDHPALQRFRGAQDVDVGTAEFTKYFRLQPGKDDRNVRQMARFANGSPALVERRFGLGRVVVAASGANTEWNTLPMKPLFLPLLHQLVAYLASGAEGAGNGRVGETLARPLPLSEASKPVIVTNPAGARTTLKAVIQPQGALVTLPRPERAGFYRLAVAGGTRDIFAVNRDPAEANLRSLSQEQVTKLLSARSLTWIGVNEDLVSALTRSRQGVELWRYLLIAALALMALETMLAQLFGRRA